MLSDDLRYGSDIFLYLVASKLCLPAEAYMYKYVFSPI